MVLDGNFILVGGIGGGTAFLRGCGTVEDGSFVFKGVELSMGEPISDSRFESPRFLPWTHCSNIFTSDA